MPIDPRKISRFKKEKYLQSLSEDDFRDKVVRPVFLRTGLKDGRDYCGVDEEGKDCVFIEKNSLGQELLYAVQTKKGKLNKTRKASESLLSAAVQLKTALETKVAFSESKQKKYPNFAILCTSGKINDKARRHICDEIKDTRVLFKDSDDLVPLIDTYYGEFWYGIDAKKMPYLRNLKRKLTETNENVVFPGNVITDPKFTPVTDEIYEPLYLYFTTTSIKKQSGKSTSIPKLEQIPADSLLKWKNNKILILGEAGSGKSTVLKRLAYVLCDQDVTENKNFRIPILLRATEINNSSQKFIESLTDATKKIVSDSSSFTVEDLIEGSVIVLLDAIDELENNEERNAVLAKIKHFTDEYPKCKIIITSRDYTYLKNLDELSSFEEFRITNIDLKQAKRLVERLIRGKTRSKEAVQEMVRRLQNIHGIDLSPLLVTVFVATSDLLRKDIPANITELFKKYTEMMLGRWDLNKGLSQQYQAPLKDHLLKKLAYEMHKLGVVSISQEDCRSLIKGEMEKIGKKEFEINLLIDEAINRSGLFRCFDDRLEFRHMLLQEFFAGRGIPSSDLIPDLIKSPWWQKAIIFYFGENPGESNTLENVVSSLVVSNSADRFHSSVTFGLALQACYLVTVVKKTELLKWVVKNLTIASKDLVPIKPGDDAKSPLSRFILFYMFGRDSVACDILEACHNEFASNLIAEEETMESKDLIQFWILVGLIECGEIEIAEKIISKFNPKDLRLLLALHLGCFYLSHEKISSQKQRDIAEKICKGIAPKVNKLRLELLEEYKSELLEVRGDKVKAIERKED